MYLSYISSAFAKCTNACMWKARRRTSTFRGDGFWLKTSWNHQSVMTSATADPTQHHPCPSVVPSSPTARSDWHKVFPFPSSPSPPIHFISLNAETKGHPFCSILLKHLYFKTFFLSISMDRFPGFFPRPVYLLLCLPHSFLPSPGPCSFGERTIF